MPTRFPTKPIRLAVVGEAPGFQEAARGRPFVGPSGQLLNQVLRQVGYEESEVMYTNVCLCRPPDNATPTRAATAACRPRLLNELRTSGVSDVLTLGGTAASALVDDSRTITHLRVGPPKKPTSALDDSSIQRVVATWHTAYCLRNADAFPAFTTDVAKLREGDRPAWRPPEWRYFDDPKIAIAALDELERRADTLVVDIEVGIEKDFAFGHPNEYDLLCVGLGYARGKVVVIGDRALKSGAALDRLRKLLRRVKIVAHNGKFDLGGLYPHLGGLELWFDTMLASYCLDERPGNHGLKVLAVEKLGAPQYDLEIRQYVPKRGNYADIPRALLYKYNAYDVACTYDLYEMFSQSLESTPGLRALHDFLVAASNQLMYLELNGITIDRAYASTLRGIFLKRLEEIEARLDDIVKRAWTDKEMKGHLTVGPKVEGLPSWDPQSGGPKVTEDPYLVVVTEKVQPFPSGINPRSPKQVKEYLASQSIRVDSTNVEVLKILGERLAPDTDASRFVYELLKYRRQHKLYSTYVEGIRKRTYRGRVYTTYMLHGTTSGRLASRNPNLQNIVRDKDIRRQFGVSRPGNVLIQCDYKQAEARVMATLAQDEYLRTILSRDEPGYDFFDELSDQLYGPGNWRKDVERIRTKAFFYGLGYGRQAYSIALEYSMSVREAEQRLQEFMSLIPATVAWQKKVRNEVLAGNDLVTTFGRHRRFWLITEQNKKEVMNEALSFLPQSTASDICLRAATHVRPRMRGLGFLRLTIHDALTAECAADKQDEVAQILIDEMTRSGQEWTDYVPFPVDVKVGTSWGDFA